MAEISKDGKTAEPRAWQRMLSGRRLDLLDPSPLDVEVEDIAHGLARVARWNGQTIGDHVYSVAQHSLLVAKIGEALFPKARPEWQLLLLLHDAPEYVIGDMISPFKAVMGGAYKQIEKRLESAIHIRYSLPVMITEIEQKAMKSCDRMAAFFEATHLAGFSHEEATKFFKRPRGISLDQVGKYLEPMPVTQVENWFLDEFANQQDILSGKMKR